MRYRFLIESNFYSFLAGELYRFARGIAARYKRQGRLPARLRHLSGRYDVRLDSPQRLFISPLATIESGAIFGVPPWIAEADPAKLIVRDSAYIGEGVELGLAPGAILDVGENTSMHRGTVILGNVRIGRNCSLGYNIYVAAGTHVVTAMPPWLHKDQDEHFFESTLNERTVIEDDVWIGWGVFIKSGVTVGRGAVIGANAVVTKDIEPYSICAGTPARKIAERLAFAPRQTISATSDEDMPYFYAGFADDRASLAVSRQRGLVLCVHDTVRVRMTIGLNGHLHVSGEVISAPRQSTLTITVRNQEVDAGPISEGKFEKRIDLSPWHFSRESIDDFEIVLSIDGIDSRGWGIREIAWRG
jgi:acetyltransferase-like isoleucine patch superfamily enzyme